MRGARAFHFALCFSSYLDEKDYPEQDFHASWEAFTKQRKKLLEALKGLPKMTGHVARHSPQPPKDENKRFWAMQKELPSMKMNTVSKSKPGWKKFGEYIQKRLQQLIFPFFNLGDSTIV